MVQTTEHLPNIPNPQPPYELIDVAQWTAIPYKCRTQAQGTEMKIRQQALQVDTFLKDPEAPIVYTDASTELVGSAIAFHDIGGETETITSRARSKQQARCQADVKP